MSFVGRARSSFERGDTLRAVLTLVAGLRRTPEHSEALKLLVDLVRDEVESGGIEHEIAQVLQPQPRRDELLSEMVFGLRDRGEDRIANRLVLEAERRGMKVIPPPEPEPELEPEPEPDTESEPTFARAEEPQPSDDAHAEDASELEAKTTSEERDRRQEEAALADARLKERKREVIAQRQAELGARRRRRTVQVVVVALIIGIAFVGVYIAGAASRSADMTKLESAIVSFNRFDEQSLEIVSKAAAKRDDAEFSERLAFARALAGEVSEVSLDDGITSWGLAAGVVAALQKDDVENALSLVTKAERTESGSLGSVYARALLEEHRGNTNEAREAASRVIDRYAAFAPAHEIVVRASARQLEIDETQAAVEQLATIAPSHPYIILEKFPSPRRVLLGPRPSADEPEELVTEDSFLRAFQSYRRAVASAASRDFEGVAQHAKSALEADAQMLPARLLRANALVATGAIEDGVWEFERAANDARSAQVRLLIQASAPLSLSGAGRPDLAARFTTPYPKLRAEGVDDRFDEALGDARPESLRKSALSDVAMIPWAADALYARAHARAEQGERLAAQAMYSDLVARNIAPGRGNTMLASLGGPANGDDPLMRAVGAFRSGDFDYAWPPDWVPAPWAVPLEASVRARSALAMDRVGDALRILDAAPVGLAHAPRLAGERMLAASHLGRQNVLFEKLAARYQLDEVRGATSALRVAEAMFWQRKFGEAEKWLEHARSLNARAPDVAWVCALISTGRSRDEAVGECLSGAATDVDAISSMQAALGFVELELGRKRAAISHFERALELDPSSSDAARGLGEALVDDLGGRAVAAIDKAAGGLESAAVAELQRWAAVAMGSRKGEEKALVRLEAARGALGESAELNAEFARYHAAREDWDHARQLYEGALRLDDSMADAHLAVARIKLRTDDQTGARQHLQRFLELDPQSASATWAREQLE